MTSWKKPGEVPGGPLVGAGVKSAKIKSLPAGQRQDPPLKKKLFYIRVGRGGGLNLPPYTPL